MALILVVGVISCQKTLDLNANTFDPSIAIFGVLEADSVPKIFVTESEPYYTYIDRQVTYQLIKDANITIADGSNTWTLQPDSVYYIPIEQRVGFFGEDDEEQVKKTLVFTTDLQLKSNITYTVSVTKNSTTATAVTTILDNVGNFDAEIKEELIEYEYGDFIREILDIKFGSQAYGQFYRTLIKQNGKFYVCELIDGMRVPSDTIISEYIIYNPYNEIVDSIDVQNQKAYFGSSGCSVRNCSGENEFVDFIEIEVAIQVMDSNMVKYINQLKTQEEVAYNPFLEPAPVDQQVENGIGILSSSAISQWKTIKILCD